MRHQLPKHFELTPEQRHEIFVTYRRLAWKLWVYLKANPDILALNNNQEVYDAVQKISVRYFIHKFPDYTFEKALEVQDMISDLEAKYYASDLYFEQDTLDIYRPGIPHDQRWAAVTFIELMFYAISPDSYTKEVHEMMPEEDSERTRMQTQI